MKTSVKKVEKVELPEGIKAEHLKYPEYTGKDEDRFVDELVFLHSDRIGWVVGTSLIFARPCGHTLSSFPTSFRSSVSSRLTQSARKPPPKPPSGQLRSLNERRASQGCAARGPLRSIR